MRKVTNGHPDLIALEEQLSDLSILSEIFLHYLTDSEINPPPEEKEKINCLFLKVSRLLAKSE